MNLNKSLPALGKATSVCRSPFYSLGQQNQTKKRKERKINQSLKSNDVYGKIMFLDFISYDSSMKSAIFDFQSAIPRANNIDPFINNKQAKIK